MSWLLLQSGGRFDLLCPEDSVFDWCDIAVGLSRCARFSGQTHRRLPPYSVAEHCVRMSFIVAPELALAALLHDASEAFLGDVTRPLKALLPAYRLIEDQTMAMILARFGLPPVLPPAIKQADRVMLATERRDLMPADDAPWPVLGGIEPLPGKITPWPTAREAAWRFEVRLAELMEVGQ